MPVERAMGTSNPATRTYRPVQFAVMPGSAARGTLLGLFYLGLLPLVYRVVMDVFEGTAAGPMLADVQGALGWGGLAGLGFLGAGTLTIGLSWLGYRRREYEVGPDGITARHGILLRSEEFLGYDEFEGVTVTESSMQALYGAGTVRLTDFNQAKDEQLVMKLSYVRNPEDVSTNILRQLADVTGATAGQLETGAVDELAVESESISRLSADELAAGTGFRYLMPSAILHPRPVAAAKFGATLGLTYSLAGVAIIYYFRDLVRELVNPPSSALFAASIGVGVVAFSLLLAGLFYLRYDSIQYELYGDHIKVIRDEKTTSMSLDEVAEINLTESGLSAVMDGLVPGLRNDIGHIRTRDETGDDLIVFKYIASSQAVSDELKEWVETSREDEQAGTSGSTVPDG
ncbi:MAG: PH domain-containing protein [Halovenus sp.]